ncbi:DUF3098 domain-containing protein [Telluribacter humicola]|uniref:DUF3098 domain-containing protein n=1 Tax=Telluribacter humicola TaxID=1720261 RepID=UPI001A977788|nr:DUF3098 domain-containing protein [Telluribacter humicola]
MSATKNPFPFSSTNYRLLLIGLALILGGFIIMNLDSEEFGFGVLGLTIGPLVTISGFIVEFWAILRKPSDK